MEIKPIAYFRSPFSSKFGIPKQAGLVAELEGQIVFEPEFRNSDALRGMEGFGNFLPIGTKRTVRLFVLLCWEAMRKWVSLPLEVLSVPII